VVQRETSLLATYLGISDPVTQLWWLALITFVIWGLESLTEYVALVQWRNLAQELQHDLRRAIGLVSQGVFLFHGSVRDNVAYGRPDASDDEIRRACELAEAASFIDALPFGYDTIVGERGQKLSGGQRQRLSLARAILKDPPILVLDEATSAVDNETEAAIQRSLEALTQDRTTVVIAHRLSTIRHAETIYVLDQGRVIEAGRHEQPLAAAGAYAALWQVQTGARWRSAADD